MHEKLTPPLSCHTFNVHRIYYSRFSSFSYKVLAVLEFLFKISGWLKYIMTETIYVTEKMTFHFQSSYSTWPWNKTSREPEAKSFKGRP